MFKILKSSHPYYLVEDRECNNVQPFAVYLKTEYGFYQQLGHWYTSKGWAERAYNNYLKNATRKILDRSAT